MNSYYALGRRKGDKEWKRVEVTDWGFGDTIKFPDGGVYTNLTAEIKFISDKPNESLKKTETPEKTLNLHQMLDDIRLLVENDFCFDMDLKTMPNSKEYTQEEARQMAWIIGRVYSIAHCTTCEACQRKYLK